MLLLPGLAESAEAPSGDPHWFRLGNVVGAVWEEGKGQLHIVGDRDAKAAGFSAQDLAVALEWGSGRADNPGYVSIDPKPADPKGPFMDVVVNDEALNTSFGWTMFEADRVMKSMALGADSLTRAMVDIPVPGFKTITKISDSRSDASTDIWSRFWFRPGPHQEQADRHAFRISNATVRIDTEVLLRKGNALVSSGGKRDPVADEFANFFNSNYDKLAREEPVLQRLQQLFRLLLVAEWVRSQRFPIDSAYLRHAAEPQFPMPMETPSIGVESISTHGAAVRHAQVFGGVSFAGLELAVARANLERFATDALDAARKPHSVATAQTGAGVAVASIPPDATRRPRYTKHLLAKIPLLEGRFLELWGRPPVGGELSEYDAEDTVLAQPELFGVNPNPVTFERGVLGPSGSSRRTEKRGVQGQEPFPLRAYQLFDVEGQLCGNFTKHRLDQQMARFVVEPLDASDPWVLLPDGESLVWAQQSPEHLLHFEPRSGLLLAEQFGRQLVIYQRNRHQTLERITLADQSGKEQPLFQGTLGNNGRRLLSLRPVSGGTSIELTHASKRLWPASERKQQLKVRSPYQKPGEWRTLSIDMDTGTLEGTGTDARLAEYLGIQGHRIARALLQARDTPTVLGLGARTLVISGKTRELWLLDTSVENRTRLVSLFRRATDTAPEDALEAEDGFTAFIFKSAKEYQVELTAGDGRHVSLSGAEAQAFVRSRRNATRPTPGPADDLIQHGLPEKQNREQREKLYQLMLPRASFDPLDSRVHAARHARLAG